MRRREFVSLVGSAVAWPLAAGAEPIRNKYRLAFLTPVALNRDYRPIKEFFDELARSGYVEGQNIIIEVFSTDGNSERRSEIARDAVRGNPDAIFVITGPLTQHAKNVSATIPIVCETADPIASDLRQA
jgi:putative tryptophan/tyrosine transport system substrate-binding protein